MLIWIYFLHFSVFEYIYTWLIVCLYFCFMTSAYSSIWLFFAILGNWKINTKSTHMQKAFLSNVFFQTQKSLSSISCLHIYTEWFFSLGFWFFYVTKIFLLLIVCYESFFSPAFRFSIIPALRVLLMNEEEQKVCAEVTTSGRTWTTDTSEDRRRELRTTGRRCREETRDVKTPKICCVWALEKY